MMPMVFLNTGVFETARSPCGDLAVLVEVTIVYISLKLAVGLLIDTITDQASVLVKGESNGGFFCQ